MAAMRLQARRARNQRWLRVGIIAVVGLFFVIPLLSMLDFSTQLVAGGRGWVAWKALIDDPALRSAIITSMELAALTAILMLVLLVPTMVWVRLRVQWATKLLELLCLLPLTIPAIVIVVGIAPIYSWVAYFGNQLGDYGDSPLTLTFAYVILVLPYAYRALDAGLGAIDVTTLSEAARSLGASWFTVITRVIAPNIASAVLSASFLSVALVLGEFTFASLLHFDNLQVVINLFGKSDGHVAVAASLASLLFAFVLLLALSFVGRRTQRKEV
jgi:putative spermidine/putrescine transport system permease protein